ncbi:MAG: FTR1 family protein [Cytophagales bacterium]|nr:FTR1 family protein [Cytophagales bacterium]
MFQTLLISFREGLEALLVVAIATLYLRRTGREHLLSAIRSGLALSVTLCLILGYVLSRIGEMSPIAAGIMALLAAVAVVWCVIHMIRAGKTMGREITAKLEEASILDGSKAWLAVFGFTFFMVGREGVETVTMIASLATNADIRYMVWGGIMGLGLAALVAWAWVRFGKAIDLGRFFRVTSWFLAIFAVQLVVYALHELTEANVIPHIDNAWWHANTEAYAEGFYAQMFSLALVVVPTVWLGALQWRDHQAAQRLH